MAMISTYAVEGAEVGATGGTLRLADDSLEMEDGVRSASVEEGAGGENRSGLRLVLLLGEQDPGADGGGQGADRHHDGRLPGRRRAISRRMRVRCQRQRGIHSPDADVEVV
jgi:hypothetical protein